MNESIRDITALITWAIVAYGIYYYNTRYKVDYVVNQVKALKDLFELKNSGALSDDEYSALRGRIIKDVESKFK